MCGTSNSNAFGPDRVLDVLREAREIPEGRFDVLGHRSGREAPLTIHQETSETHKAGAPQVFPPIIDDEGGRGIDANPVHDPPPIRGVRLVRVLALARDDAI